jgi:hypothetical protein
VEVGDFLEVFPELVGFLYADFFVEVVVADYGGFCYWVG